MKTPKYVAGPGSMAMLDSAISKRILSREVWPLPEIIQACTDLLEEDENNIGALFELVLSCTSPVYNI